MSDMEIGVGIDVARYEHVVQFWSPAKEPIRHELAVPESREGYDALQQAMQELDRIHHRPVFRINMDMANVYGQNLQAFLQQQSFRMVITELNPLTNRRYKEVFLQDNRSDAIDAAAAARFAIVEKPKASPHLDPFHQRLLAVVSRYESQTRSTTRLVCQLHQALSRAWPEFPGLFGTLQGVTARAVLRKAPTAHKAAETPVRRLSSIRPSTRSPQLGAKRARQIIASAQASTASLAGPDVEFLVRDLVQQLDQSLASKQQLYAHIEALYTQAQPNWLMSIPGVGAFTAGVLTAKIVSIDRFASPDKLVGYFGVYSVIHESGTRKGQLGMSRKGNDLVRKALFMACQSGVQHNPALRRLYHRKLSQGKPKMVALGHCMRKLLHLVYAVWTKQEPFDPTRHERPARPQAQDSERQAPQGAHDAAHDERSSQRSEPTETTHSHASTQARKRTSNRPAHAQKDARAPTTPASPSRGGGRTKKCVKRLD